MSLRTRIMLLALLATLVPAALIFVQLLEQRDADIANAKHQLHAQAATAASDLGEKISGTVQLLHGLSRAPDLDAGDRQTCSDFLADVLKRYPQFTGLLTVRPDGRLHCDSLRTGRVLDLNDRGYFKEARGSTEPAFELVFGRLTGIAVLQIAFAARDSRGELKSVLLASLNLAQFAMRVATAGALPGMEVMIWDGKGTVMARYPDIGPKRLAGSSRAESALYRFVRSEQDGATAELAGLHGVPKIWARSALETPAGTGLRITLGVSRDALLAEANRDLREALTVLGVGSLLALLVALAVAELGIRRPVARIMTAAKRQGGGDAGARICAPYPRGELGELMTTLDATAAAVQAQQADIGRKSVELQRINRTMQVLSAINSTIVRVHDRDALLAEACRIAVEEGGFPIAWVGLLDRESMQVKPLAWRGVDEAYVRAMSPAASDLEGLAGAVIRDKRAVIVSDTASDPRLRQREQALKLGSRSVAAMPLIVSGEVTGVFVLHAREAGFFDAQEMKLLNELAEDIAFALDYIEKSAKLDFLAYYDAVTGLANRHLFQDRLSQFLGMAGREARVLAVLVIDIERFRTINEVLGRQAGDDLLKQFAERTRSHMTDQRWLARIGGDQFASMIPDVTAANVIRLIEQRQLEVLSAPFRIGETEVAVSVKIGIALFPEDGADAEALLKNAESALKKAKASGERYLFYAASMTATVAGKLTLENQLRRALEKEEFVLHYQPKVDLVSGKLTGCEALIRWNDPRTGLVPPGRFIPILEETGLIYDVGRWAMHKALEDYLRWRKERLPAVRIAVNVSPLQLRNRHFIDEIRRAIDIDPYAAAGLELELTESLIMEDVKHSIAILQAIRAMGVTIAIDDFGTGYSSLSYLAKLPVDTLKIDRSFVTDMTAGPDGLALVSMIINLAQSLRLKVVAEGVETEEQSHLLRLLRCDEMQGFLFSKAVPAEIFEAKFLAPPGAG